MSDEQEDTRESAIERGLSQLEQQHQEVMHALNTGGENPQDDLPELQDATIDAAVVIALFDDIEQCAELREILVKGAARSLSGQEQPYTLAEARDALLQGEIRAVQLRYTFENTPWCDTITVLPKGFHLIRMEQQGLF